MLNLWGFHILIGVFFLKILSHNDAGTSSSVNGGHFHRSRSVNGNPVCSSAVCEMPAAVQLRQDSAYNYQKNGVDSFCEQLIQSRDIDHNDYAPCSRTDQEHIGCSPTVDRDGMTVAPTVTNHQTFCDRFLYENCSSGLINGSHLSYRSDNPCALLFPDTASDYGYLQTRDLLNAAHQNVDSALDRSPVDCFDNVTYAGMLYDIDPNDKTIFEVLHI